MEALSYRVLLRKEPGGGYTVTVPSLPGCVTYGETIEEGIAMAREVIGLYLESLQVQDEQIPNEADTVGYTFTVPAYAWTSPSHPTESHRASGTARLSP